MITKRMDDYHSGVLSVVREHFSELTLRSGVQMGVYTSCRRGGWTSALQGGLQLLDISDVRVQRGSETVCVCVHVTSILCDEGVGELLQ